MNPSEVVLVGYHTVSMRDFNRWLNALYSGEYEQGVGALESDQGFCCLGVACDVLIPRKLKQTSWGQLNGMLPAAQNHAPKWLKDINEDFYDKTGITLSDLNDCGVAVDGTLARRQLSFEEIADLIYAVYVLEVLK